ncbi:MULTISPECIES: hypothetical protein [Burkholderia cepacia complex]|uniref:hypothetical protein n=1 Tax=Burkholderia cepacia complex TaxID=87882 RepID=UPI00158AE372|nr:MULTISPECIES: hypothetical protein [Burkholderia cepacia complex]MDR5643303.1 hypothetical protein [Burkholderia cenocepacia]
MHNAKRHFTGSERLRGACTKVAAALLAVSPLSVAQTSLPDPLDVEPPGTPQDIVAIWEEFYNQQTIEVQVVNGICVETPMTRRQWLTLHRAR